MRVSRIYTEDKLVVGDNYELIDDNAHYARTVLRLKHEQPLVLFNGLGGEYLCRLIEVSRKRVIVKIIEARDRSVESPLNITMGMGISRGDRMDWAVQKAVELGVNSITPLLTERCVVKLKEDKKKQKMQHWKHIIQHASEQCGRTVLPQLNQIENIEHWVGPQKGLKVFLDPHANNSLVDLQPIDMKITLLSGPEGGFCLQEREIAIEAGFVPVRLGQRVLRTETATLAALSAVQMLWGDFV